MLESLLQDIRFAARAMARRPGATLAAVVTLTLGIGATAALVTMVDHVLLRPLVYGESERLYSVWGVVGAANQIQPSYPDFRDWRDAARTVDIAYAYGDVYPLRGSEGVEQVLGGAVSAGFFDVMATPAALGRTFAPEEEASGEPVLVLSHGYWVRRFGADPGVVGREVVIANVSHEVIGVMPPGFEWPEWAEVWLPITRSLGREASLGQRDARVDSRAIARLWPGVSEAEAEAELEAIAARLAETWPDTNDGLGLRLSSLREEVIGEVRPTLLAMLAAAALVLLLACANVAALLLGRAAERSRELAVRGALGASRGRLARQLLTESLVLAGAGGVLGTLLAGAGVEVIAARAAGLAQLAGVSAPRLEEVGVDPRALALALVVTVSAGVLFGLAPALSGSARQPAARLREQGRGGGLGRGTVRAQWALAVAQLAVAAALLSGAGLLGRTLEELREVDPGFRPEGLVVLRVFPPERYAGPEARLAFYDRLRERAGGVPGVSSAALINHMPYAAGLVPTRVAPVEAPPDSSAFAVYRTASPGFFATAGVRVLRGRAFEPGEARAPVVILSAMLADSLWPGAEAVGRRVRVTNPTPPSARRGEVFTAEVIGVVDDARDAPRSDPVPTLYVPHAYDPWGNITLVARSAGGAGAVVAPLRRAALEVDPDLPVADLQPLAERVRGATTRERLSALLMLGFATLAVTLALVGTYGALANLVARRAREFGIRMALGARPWDVRRIVLVRVAGMLAPGLVLGAAGAWLLGRLFEGLLFGVAPTDPFAALAAGAALASVALLASLVPTRRAGRVDPVELLAEE